MIGNILLLMISVKGKASWAVITNYDGNMTSDGRFHYFWNGENRLVMASNDTTVVTYAYDHRGRMISTTLCSSAPLRLNKTTTYIWDDWNTNGEVVAHYDYAPFGELLVSSGPLAATFTHQFSTKPYCPVTGFCEYQMRKYWPVIGRWMSRDPLSIISKETSGIAFNTLRDAEENTYVFNVNKSVDSYDFIGMATIPWLPGTPSIVPPNNPCPEKCCNGKKIQMVPVWNCTRKFAGIIEVGPIKHGYVCCDAANFNCFGIQKYRKQCMMDCIASEKKTKEDCKRKCFSKKGDPIDPEIDPTGSCEMKCVMPEEKATACNSPTMPWDYSIPKKHHCYAWADSVTTTKCK